MLNPIITLYYQYFWWQRRHGHRDIAVWSALSLLSVCTALYIISGINLFLFLVYRIYGSVSFRKEIDCISLIVIVFILYNILYKKKYKIIIKERKYRTTIQSIIAILYACGAFIITIGGGVLIYLMKRGT